jgi:hypothetical protein
MKIFQAAALQISAALSDMLEGGKEGRQGIPTRLCQQNSIRSIRRVFKWHDQIVVIDVPADLRYENVKGRAIMHADTCWQLSAEEQALPVG